MGNIIIGIIFIIGGLSGKIALRGTNSSQAIALVGAGLVVWGIVQIVRNRSAVSASGNINDDRTA